MRVGQVRASPGRCRPPGAALRESSVESRFEALHTTGLTDLVGRETELLLRRWSRAKTGDGQVVLLSGEPGIRDEARNLLAPVYGWFTEGFYTLDLKDARALLDDLAQ
jgi:hypothetical protein